MYRNNKCLNIIQISLGFLSIHRWVSHLVFFPFLSIKGLCIHDHVHTVLKDKAKLVWVVSCHHVEVSSIGNKFRHPIHQHVSIQVFALCWLPLDIQVLILPYSPGCVVVTCTWGRRMWPRFIISWKFGAVDLFCIFAECHSCKVQQRCYIRNFLIRKFIEK